MNPNNSTIIFRDKSGKSTEYDNQELLISTVGSDLLIHLGRKTIALDWSEEHRITISNLNKVIKHRWTYLQEHDTDWGCDDCDGYNYDNCDMFRCKNDCEHCGGRRFVCNNGCFYHRYKTCVTIECNSNNAKNDLNEVLAIVKRIESPHSEYEQILMEHGSSLEQLYSECGFVSSYCSCDVIDSYLSHYENMKKKVDCRRIKDNDRVKFTIHEDGDTKKYMVSKESLSVKNHGFIPLFGKIDILIDGYDSITDDFISIKMIAKFANHNDKELLKKINEQNNIHSISLTIRKGIVISLKAS